MSCRAVTSTQADMRKYHCRRRGLGRTALSAKETGVSLMNPMPVYRRDRDLVSTYIRSKGFASVAPIFLRGFAHAQQPTTVKLTAVEVAICALPAAPRRVEPPAEDAREVSASQPSPNVYKAGAYCRIEYEPSPQSVVSGRGGVYGLAHRLRSARRSDGGRTHAI